jgi:ABC-type Fe3+-citrate transport system substrate-binding protein
VAEVRQALAEARQLATGHERSVVVGVFAGTGFTAHSNASFKGSLLIDLGLTTPLEPLDGQTQYLLDLEGIAAAAPEAFVVTCSPADQGIWDEFASQPVWQGLQAVRNNAVYLFNRDLWSRSRGIIALHLILRDARESGLLTGEPSTYTSCPEPVIE